MKLKNVMKFQEGGAMAPQAAPAEPQEAQAPAGAGSPEEMLMQIAQTAMQALQNQDCDSAMAVCQAFVQMIQEQQSSAAEPAEPVYRAGGKLVRRINK